MQPLKDIRVLGVTVFLAGPYTSMNLSRFGAEVIKVEIPGRGDPVRGNGPFSGPEGIHPTRQTDIDLSTRFLKRTQGVKSITLNLKSPEGRQMFLDLAKECDVVLENLAPGSMTKLGLGYEDVRKVNEKIIYCSISGYGQTGEYAYKPAHDPQIQAMAGMMDINGETEGPPMRVGFYIGDLFTPMFACYSITAALRERDRTGKGEYLDVSMMDTLTSVLMMENLEEDVESGVPMRTGNISRGGPTGLYKAKDGDVSITVASDDQWRKFTNAFEATDLFGDPRFSTFQLRVENVEEARVEMQKLIGTLTRDELMELFEKHDVPCGLVRGIAEVIEDEHFWNRGSMQPMRHAAMDEPVKGIASGFPVVFSDGPIPPMAGAPTLGMHNSEIYGSLLNLSDDDLEKLREKGVI